MHEMALAESVIRIIEDAARAEGFRRVAGVRLEIGRLASVEPEAMRFCFEAASRDTVAEGARLEIASAPGRARCFTCGREFELSSHEDPCPGCGGYRWQVTAGTDMRVSELEVA